MYLLLRQGSSSGTKAVSLITVTEPGGVRAIVWLQARPINRSLNAAICLTIAVGVGVLIFAVAY